MKIGVEASAAFRTHKTGVGYYAHNLLMALAKTMPQDEFDLCYISFITKTPEHLNPSPANVKYRRISLFPGKIYNFLDHYLVPPPIDLLGRTRADVFFFPNFFHWPLWLTPKSVVVVHDLAFLEAPEYVVPRHRKYLARRVPESARKATHVVTVSEHAKGQMVHHYGLDPAKITVVSPALDHQKYHPAEAAEVARVKQKYGITRDYLLYLGTIEPRKNIVGIVRAYQQLPAALRERYQLVLAGGKGWLDEEINAVIEGMPKGSVVRTGYVADGDEPALYTGAKLLLYPSHYEGWGMQILEAMACGTPVLTARNSSLPEVGGEVAAYVEDTTPESISAAVQALLGDAKRLESMRVAGLGRAAASNWEASAQRLAEVFRALR